MKRFNTWSPLIVLVVIQLLSEASPCADRNVLEDRMFRVSVARSDIIVVATATATRPASAGSQFRRTTLEVERVLCGPAAIGDTLCVLWPTDTGEYKMSLWSPQLDEFEGIRALYFLTSGEPIRSSGRGLLPLIPGYAAELRRSAALIRTPPEGDALLVALDDPLLLEECCAPADASIIETRLAAVVAYLEGFLDGIAPRAMSGRSN